MRADSTTRTTLLTRVRDGADDAAWVEFQSRYREMLLRYCNSRGLQFADSEDAVQIVFAKLAQSLRTFEYDPRKGRFRDYLFRCLKNAISDLKSRPNRNPEAVVRAERLVDEDAQSAGGSAWEREWIDHHYRLAIEAVRQQCEQRSVDVFAGALAGRSVRELATEFAMTEDSIYKIQRRMKERLRDQIARQIREEDGVGD